VTDEWSQLPLASPSGSWCRAAPASNRSGAVDAGGEPGSAPPVQGGGADAAQVVRSRRRRRDLQPFRH
jgi:hypothetical protein